jgi:type VI secretion system protein ImpK
MRDEYPYHLDKICAEVIVMVLDAAKSPSVSDADKMYRELCVKFDAAIRLCEVERFPVDATLELLYPLAAFADEVFMSMPQYRVRWVTNPLQLRYFKMVDAGEAFFLRLERLIAAPEGKKRLLELYFICLALGFKGKYGMGGHGGLRELFEDLSVKLTDARLNTRGAPVLNYSGNTRKKFLSLRNGMIAAFSLLMIVATVFYLSSLVNFLKFLENF